MLTCALLLHSAHALEPLEHPAQVSDAVLEGDLLVLAGFRILQQLPHVHLRHFLLLLHLPNRGEPLPSLIAAHWPLKTRKVGVWHWYFGSVLQALFKAWVLKAEGKVYFAWSLRETSRESKIRYVHLLTLTLSFILVKNTILGGEEDTRKYP